eukprot:5345634-Prymnesium_polylepis.1
MIERRLAVGELLAEDTLDEAWAAASAGVVGCSSMLAVFDALAAGMLEVLAGSAAQRPEQPQPLPASPPPPCACS